MPDYHQETLDALFDDPRAATLFSSTFVVVDLETTGGAPDGGGITEIGAVKVRGGEVLGEFGTLVNPEEQLPAFITVLTGITEMMLLEAPKIDTVLPAFLEFAAGAVWVAHNAPYDVGFLKAACAKHGYAWPRPLVLDTAAIARRALIADEVPNHKLSTLARHFRAATQPVHRALDDARATVDVLHGLFARLGSLKVHTVGDVLEFVKAVSPAQRRKKHLADGLPDKPGVYVFRGHKDRPLYIGTSSSIATRVRSYFTAAEKRARIDEMLNAAERVEAIPCAHSLEAEVRELRLIATHKPPYNRRSKFPERVLWLKLTREAYPRLSIVRELQDDGAAYLGPFPSRRGAELAAAGVYDALPIRQCTHKLSLRTTTPACALAELGRCPAPCEHRISADDYESAAAAPFRTATVGDPGPVVRGLLARIEVLAAAERFEDAATIRARLVAFLRTAVRMQRLASLTALPELIAARPAASGGWELAVVRHGRLAAAGVSPPRVHPQPTLDVVLATAETVRPGLGPTPRASPEETERILAWLERPETRLVKADVGWASPATGAGRWRPFLARAEAAAAVQFDLDG
ncbi:DEDD exonuclease domain-containing protein [Dactylosporangium sp. AC04546]|uniref:DEDD exonuclease domain-containing protein n=1 Tax=Dactylosporangium sp. AC04546 TaxID=2862460 RepID=UPI001EDE76CB|nr:DEDD exonuclease domain-containing protein [Dactylosporangium sp. AC04546]WVK82210.1 DEDD exonuclease domain-containing protein [Dactylosporangium sp. AC04546]